MNLGQLLLITTGVGLPPPSSSAISEGDERALIRLALFPRPGPISPLVLDVSTPLLSKLLDVRGNAQHWALRCAEVALDATQPNWLARFETEEAYQTIVTERTNPAFAGFYDSAATTRRGLPMSASKAKHDRRALAGYAKAVENWNRAFGNGGDDFLAQLVGATERYAEATQRFLDLVGLDIRHFKGAFSLHVMLMCGNVDAVRFLSNVTELLAVDFPGTPIIPGAFRQAFNQDAMAVLCRNLYHALPFPDLAVINALLDGIVGGYISPFYDPPPTSFMRVEARDGGLYLHTRVLFGTAPRPPAARSWWVPLQQPVPAPGQVVLLADLFAFGVRGIDAIASCTMRIETQTTNLDQIEVWLVSTDGSEPEQRLNLHQPHQITLNALTLGERWQIVLRYPGTPPTAIVGRLEGHFWFTDTAGLDSSHEPWRIAGDAPRALNLFITESAATPPPAHLVVVEDLMSYGRPGAFPIERGHIRINNVVLRSLGIQLWLARTDGLSADVRLDTILTTPVDFVALPPGERWQLYTIGLNPVGNLRNVFFLGELWFTDTSGTQSNHAGVSIQMTP